MVTRRIVQAAGLGALSMIAVLVRPPAQQAAALIDYSDERTPVEAFVEVADRLYLVAGGGCNTTVFVTASAVVVVDPKYAFSWPALDAQIRRITDRPVTHVILTHSHPDHAGSVLVIPPQVEIVAEAHAVGHLREDGWLYRAEGAGPPVRAYTDRLTLFGGDDAITLVATGPAHTDGDTLVLFNHARVMQVGDLFPFEAPPTVNIEAGGNGPHFAEALANTITNVHDIDRVITGHGAVVPWSDLVDYADFTEFLVRYVRAEMHFGADKNAVFKGIRVPSRYAGYELDRLFNTLDEIDRGLRPQWQRVF